MNWRPVLGSRPLMAKRKRREKPALTTCGTAGARALKMASMISSPQWFVLMHTGAGGWGLTISPLGAITVIGRIDPSFLGTSAGAMYMMAACARERVLAYELLIKPVTWGLDSLRSTVIVPPWMVTVARIGTMVLSNPSSSINVSPLYTPSGQLAINCRTWRSVA